MARLPKPGSDDDIWGEILNDYLNVAHNSDGTLDASAVTNAVSDATTSSKGKVRLAGDLAGTASSPSVTGIRGISVSGTPSAGQVITASSSTDASWETPSGGGGDPVVGGDLSGTASNAQIVAGAVDTTEIANGAITNAKVDAAAAIAQSKIANLTSDLAGKQNADADLSAIAGLSPSNDDIMQRKAGAWTNRTPAQVKADLGLVAGDVGLGNVNNTSDANKPISTATQAALDAKADDSALTAHTSDTTTVHGIADTSDLVVTADIASKVDDTITVTGTNSLSGGGDLSANRTLSLVNDAATPGNDKYYGTDSGGAKGYFDLPSGGAAQIDDLSDVDTTTTPPTDGQALVWNDTNSVWEPGSSTGGFIEGDGIAKVTVGNTAPSGPAIGDVWIQTA